MTARHLVPAGVVLLALAGLAGAAQELARPAAPAASPATTTTRQAEVTSAVRACPPATDGSHTVALIAATPAASSATPAPAASGGTAGQAVLTALPLAGAQPRGAAPPAQANPGVLSLVSVPAASSGWSVTASGAMARAMEAEVAQGSGLASLRCGQPASDIWFAGPGSGNGAARITLDLMNIDALPASVDVTIITDAGLAQGGNDTGITVPPHQMVTESLSASAAGASVVAAEVRTTTGRVAAAVSEGPAHGAASWLPSTAAPATRLVIPGAPLSGHAAGLFLAVPGGSSARVSVLAITPQGQLRPFGTQTVDLPGESASYVALNPVGGTAAAIELLANVPVTAAVSVPGGGAGAFAAAAAPVTGQAVIAGNLTGSGLAASVALSAPAGAASARLTEIASGATASQVVAIPAGHTLVVPAAAPRGARRGSPFALVITPLPGSGPLYAARVETQDQTTVLSIIPAITAPATLTLPPARDSYDAIAP